MSETLQLLTPKEAASLLKVSVSYLRNSDCPKIRLPGGKGVGRQVVRFNRAEVERWLESHAVRRSA